MAEQILTIEPETWKELFDKHLKEFVIYVAKDPKDFLVR